GYAARILGDGSGRLLSAIGHLCLLDKAIRPTAGGGIARPADRSEEHRALPDPALGGIGGVARGIAGGADDSSDDRPRPGSASVGGSPGAVSGQLHDCVCLVAQAVAASIAADHAYVSVVPRPCPLDPGIGADGHSGDAASGGVLRRVAGLSW